MSKVYIVAAKRSAVGSFCGSLASLTASDLAAQVIRGTLEQSQINPEWLDEVIVGNVLGAAQGQGPGRMAALKAGIPFSVPAYTLNMICGSGMKVVMDAASHIKSGDAEMVLATGMESMSNAPHAMPSAIRQGVKMGEIKMVDTMLNDALVDPLLGIHMGLTAENIAEKHQLTREQQDQFSLTSQQRAVAAIAEGKFVEEIVPVTVKTRKGEMVFAVDEHPKADTTLEVLTKLRPAFKKDGTVTAGNASGLNDGAVAIVLASEAAVEKYQLQPLAELVGYAQGCVDPSVMGLGPVPAVKAALQKADLKLSDIELLELNEAFAAQALGVVVELAAEHGETVPTLLERTNVNGGAIALGHALGASGGRIIVTLLHEMKKRQLKYGLASLCIGGGMGTAVIVKSV